MKEILKSKLNTWILNLGLAYGLTNLSLTIVVCWSLRANLENGRAHCQRGSELNAIL